MERPEDRFDTHQDNQAPPQLSTRKSARRKAHQADRRRSDFCGSLPAARGETVAVRSQFRQSLRVESFYHPLHPDAGPIRVSQSLGMR
jgi:hypothetical protein